MKLKKMLKYIEYADFIRMNPKLQKLLLKAGWGKVQKILKRRTKMKVYIGPYKEWIGPYQIAEKILFWKDKYNDDVVHDFGTWLVKTFPRFNKFCNWYYGKFCQRDISITIDTYDTWSMDYTLAYIILPMLKQLRNTKYGAPEVSDSDVPGYLRKSTVPSVEHDVDDNWFKRWDYVLNEMIFAFESKLDDSWEDKFHTEDKFDAEGWKGYQARISNGFRLFGKYYENLWD